MALTAALLVTQRHILKQRLLNKKQRLAEEELLAKKAFIIKLETLAKAEFLANHPTLAIGFAPNDDENMLKGVSELDQEESHQ